MEYSNLTFTDDKLDRKDFVINITNVILQWDKYRHENESLTLTIDSPWGSGKSYLLNMWKNWLLSDDNAKNNYSVVYYNAWENDDSQNAFVPLAYNLQAIEINKSCTTYDTVKEKSKEFIKSCGIALLKDGIKKAIGEETANILIEGLSDALDKKTEDFFKEYTLYLNEKKKFEKSLEDLIPVNGKLFIFVDELDRCRPAFAVDTLEIAKHFFNIKDVVFIFAIDLNQLSHSIETLYGIGMDSSGYLRRFFDINISIPNIDIKNYTKIMLHEFVGKEQLPESLMSVITNLYSMFNLSLRDMNKISSCFMVFCMFYKKEIDNRRKSGGDILARVLEVYLYFIILKYKYPTTYRKILRQGYMTYDNVSKKWDILESMYFVSPHVNQMLTSAQTGKAQSVEDSLINTYCFNTININGISFAEHIERTIEMFS